MTITDPDAMATLSGPLFIVEHQGEMWSGSRFWMVRAEKFTPPRSGLAPVFAAAGLDVDLTPAKRGDDGRPLTVELHGDLVRVFDRPDGLRVYVSDAFFQVVNGLLMEEGDDGEDVLPEYVLKQCAKDPHGRSPALGPVSLIAPNGERIAIVMPRRGDV